MNYTNYAQKPLKTIEKDTEFNQKLRNRPILKMIRHVKFAKINKMEIFVPLIHQCESLNFGAN